MNRLRQLISEASAILGRLSSRDRMLVGVMSACVLGFLIFVVGITFTRTVKRHESAIETKLAKLNEINGLTANYRQAESRRTDLERKLRTNNVKLFSYLDELSKKQGLEIGGINDKGTTQREGKAVESSVEVTFTRISLDKLVGFLTAVEGSSGLVKITKLQIRPRSDQPVIDAWLIVTTYQLES
jgi:hypothetical protein